jgi:hypothetical protein
MHTIKTAFGHQYFLFRTCVITFPMKKRAQRLTITVKSSTPFYLINQNRLHRQIELDHALRLAKKNRRSNMHACIPALLCALSSLLSISDLGCYFSPEERGDSANNHRQTIDTLNTLLSEL